jgi:hypothetical protein
VTTFPENMCQVPHMYSVSDSVLIHQDTCGKLAKPTRGPYQLIDVACQHVNGTIVIDLNHSNKCSTFGDWFHILNPLKGVHDMCQWQFGSVVMKPSSIKVIISICAFHRNDHFDECTKCTKTVCLSLPMTISLLKWSFW